MFRTIGNQDLKDSRLWNKNSKDTISSIRNYRQPTSNYVSPSPYDSKIAHQNSLDTDLMLQNSRIGQMAVGKFKNVVKKMTPIEEEVLHDFVAEEGFEYTDPISGDVRIVRHNIPEGKYPALDDSPAGIIANKKDEFIPDEEVSVLQNIVQRELAVLNDEIEVVVDDYKNVIQEIQDLQKLIDNEPDRNIRHQLKLDIKQKNNEATLIRKEIKRIKTEIEAVNVNFQDKLLEREQHNALITIKRQNNRDLVEKYKQELNILNSDKFQMTQLPTETEAQYLERLQQNAIQDIPEHELQDAQREVQRKFREKMKELIKNASKIDQVCNTIDELGKIDNKAQLLKIWTYVKTKFLSLYGFDNKAVSPTEIVELFNLILSRGLEEAIYNKPKSSIAPSLTGITAEAIPNENTLLIVNQTTQKPLYLKSVIVSGGNYMNYSSSLRLLYSFTGNKGSFKQYFDKQKGRVAPPDRKGINNKLNESGDDIEGETGITRKDLNQIFNQQGDHVNSDQIAKKLCEIYKIQPLLPADTDQENYGVSKTSTTKNHVQYGYGIENKDIPKYASFGNILINMQKLYYQHIISAKDKNMKSINGLPNHKASEKFASIILNLLEGIHPTREEINRLATNDRQYYDRLIHLGKLHKQLPSTHENTIGELKKRLKLLEGEINIGNTSPQLKHEIKQILIQLFHFKTITKKQIDDYLKQF